MIWLSLYSLTQPDTRQTGRRLTNLHVNKAVPLPSLTPLSKVSWLFFSRGLLTPRLRAQHALSAPWPDLL